VKPEQDVYCCAADIGWITGHSYIVYGPLANGVTSVVYEGSTPDFPDKDRLSVVFDARLGSSKKARTTCTLPST
jgi:acyl-coenzyme A synthetase/AMP-(fatty) acid ligase